MIIPAATVRRQLPDVVLVLGPTGLTVHAAAGDQLRCSTRLRRRTTWEDQPVRLCQLCAATLVPATARGRFWQPNRAELAAVHLHEAWRINAAAAEQVADIRSQAMADGSALVLAESLPEYRAARGLPDDAPVAAAHQGGQLIGAVLAAAAPAPVDTVIDEHAHALQLQARRLQFEQLAAGSRGRRQDLRAAREARKAHR